MNRMLVLAAALDSDQELGVAFAARTAVIAGSGSSFFCPVIKVPRSGA
jgi:hypothetical protein